MSQWTANGLSGVLKRSTAFDEYIRKEYGQKQEWIRRNNWKYDQIEKLKQERKARSSAIETRG